MNPVIIFGFICWIYGILTVAMLWCFYNFGKSTVAMLMRKKEKPSEESGKVDG